MGAVDEGLCSPHRAKQFPGYHSGITWKNKNNAEAHQECIVGQNIAGHLSHQWKKMKMLHKKQFSLYMNNSSITQDMEEVYENAQASVGGNPVCE